MGNGAEKRLNTYLFLWNVPGRFLAYMLPRYVGFFTGLVALVAPQYQRESPTQTRASAAKVISFPRSPITIGEAEEPGEESTQLWLLRAERSTGKRLEEAREKRTSAQTIEIATDRPKSFLHLF